MNRISHCCAVSHTQSTSEMAFGEACGGAEPGSGCPLGSATGILLWIDPTVSLKIRFVSVFLLFFFSLNLVCFISPRFYHFGFLHKYKWLMYHTYFNTGICSRICQNITRYCAKCQQRPEFCFTHLFLLHCCLLITGSLVFIFCD